MPSYDLKQIAEELEKEKSKAAEKDKKNNAKLKYFKPEMGRYDIRFIPFREAGKQPILEIGFYEKLQKMRLVAPCTWGLEDPVKEIFEEVRKKKDGWDLAKTLKPRERYFAVIINRAQEEEGPLVWEFSKAIRDRLYTILTSKKYAKKDLLSITNGFDFELKVSPEIADGVIKKFNGFPVKKFDLDTGEEDIPLHPDPKVVEKWMSSLPDIEGTNRKYCKSPEELTEILANYIASFTEGSQMAESDEKMPTPPSPTTAKVAVAPKALADATMRAKVVDEDEEENMSVDDVFKDNV